MELPRVPALHFMVEVSAGAERLSDEALDAALRRLREHCVRGGQRRLQLLLHAAGPLPAGPGDFEALCLRVHTHLREVARAELLLQTEDPRFDARWAEVLARQAIRVGVKLAPGEGRVDPAGLEALRRARVPFSLLMETPLGAGEPVALHRRLMALAPAAIEYRLPDLTHDTLSEVRERHGRTPCADFLLPVFDDWWRHGTMDVPVGPFVAMVKAILGGRGEEDVLGHRPPRIHPLGGGEVRAWDAPREGEALTLPEPCQRCPEVDTCAGGYPAHRYSRERRFDNPSVWCEDLLRLFGHLRERLGIPPEETRRRARVLARKAAGAPGSR